MKTTNPLRITVYKAVMQPKKINPAKTIEIRNYFWTKDGRTKSLSTKQNDTFKNLINKRPKYMHFNMHLMT